MRLSEHGCQLLLVLLLYLVEVGIKFGLHLLSCSSHFFLNGDLEQLHLGLVLLSQLLVLTARK